MLEIVESLAGFLMGKEASRSVVRPFKISLAVSVIFLIGLIAQEIFVLKNRINIDFFFAAIPVVGIVFLALFLVLWFVKGKKIKGGD